MSKKDDQLGKIRNKGRRNKAKDVVHAGVTRADIAELLEAIGAPGKKRDEKLEAVAALKLKNPQGVDLTEDLTTYKEF